MTFPDAGRNLLRVSVQTHAEERALAPDIVVKFSVIHLGVVFKSRCRKISVFRHPSMICQLLEILVEECYGLHALFQLRKQVALVGRVNRIPLESEAYQKGIGLENLLHLGQDGN